MLAPGIADRYLARNAFSGQQMQGHPVSPDRPDNLFEPLPDKAATHGIFDDRAKRHSPLLWAFTHPGVIAGAALGAAAAVGAGVTAAVRR
jgi:hypothetical protein